MTINLTAVLITAIICLTLCYVCKNANDENKAKEKQAAKAKGNVIEIPQFVEFVGQRKSGQEQRLVEYVEEQARKRGDIEP